MRGRPTRALRAPRRLVPIGLAGLLLACSPGGSAGGTSSVDAGPLPEVRLTDQQGAAWTPQALRGQWTLVFFGFTQCPHICPLTLQQTVEARRLITERGATPPRVLFVSVDPEHDTPQALGDYLGRFGEGYTGLTGAEDEIAELERWLDATHARAARPDAATGAVDHSAYLYLIGPEGRLRERVQGVTAASTLAETLLRSMQARRSLTCHNKRSHA